MLFVGNDWAEAHHDIEIEDSEGRVLVRRRLPDVVFSPGRVQAHLLGSGWGDRPDGADVVAAALDTGLPAVVDADGLRFLPDHLPASWLLTPHAGELGRLLGVSSKDVATRRLELAREAAATARAFVVLKGDETVGVVVLRKDGDVAHVQLDYVTPRYRDFSPGEFLWRRSGVLRDLGLRRVLTPPGMVGAYYEHLGFRPEGRSFALDL